MKKLYVLEMVYHAYVWAHDEDNAEAFAHEILKEEPESFACLVERGSNPLNWDKKCLVYHDDDYDMELKEALEKMEEEAE